MSRVLLFFCLLPLIRCQTEAELLALCDGVSFPQPFDPLLGIGQFYQLATYSNEEITDIDYDCPREIWEIAKNGTIYFNRQITKNDTGYLELQSLDLAIPMISSSHSSDYIWKPEGVNSPTFGRFSYRYVNWENRRYCFVIGCRVTGLLQLFILSREPIILPPLHHHRIKRMFQLQYSHHFPYQYCASFRPLSCESESGTYYPGIGISSNAL